MLWLSFIIGQVLNILRRANLVGTSRSNPLDTWGFIARNWVLLLIRGVLGAALWALLSHNPSVLTDILGHFGWEVNLTIPLVPMCAVAFGITVDIFLDWGLEKVPFFKSELPQFRG